MCIRDSNYQAIKEQIYNLNQNFIKNFEIVYQDIDLDQPYIEVQIKANVAKGKIKQELKNLGILHDRMGYKSLMLIYQRRTVNSIQSDHEIVQNIFPAVLEAFAEHGFLTFDQQTMKQIYQLTELKKLDPLPVDSLIALALNYNAEILVIMEIIPGERDNLKAVSYTHLTLPTKA